MPTTLRCPACGGPLDPLSGPMTRCAYCNTPIALPGTDEPSPAQQYTGELVPQVESLAEIGRLLAEGHKIEAIKRYREQFGVGLKVAKDAVEQLERGEPVVLSEQRLTLSSAEGSRARGGCCLPGLLLPLLLLGGLAFALFRLFPTLSLEALRYDFVPGSPVRWAGSFGEVGVGPGRFTDARTIAVDDEGQIYVGEYEGGRIQRFAADGTFQTQWNAGEFYLTKGLEAGRDGRVYLVQQGEIQQFDGEEGTPLGPLPFPDARPDFEDLFVTPEGGLVALRDNDEVVRYNARGEITLRLPAAVQGQSGDAELNAHVAEDGQGNLFVLGSFNNAVFHYDRVGTFVNRFGSAGEGEGQWLALTGNDIAVDPWGRVYVAAFNEIEIFEPDGRHAGRISVGHPAFGLALTPDDHLLVAARDRVLRFALKSP